MKKVIIYYDFIIVSLIVLAGFFSAENIYQLLSASIYYPILIYFLTLIIPRRQKAVVLPKEIEPVTKVIKPGEKEEKLEKLTKIKTGKIDKDRRVFLKIIGTAGATAFIFSIFGVKKAQAAFFGSVPGPGIVGLKDIAGNRIDPAQHHPTDGYKISRLDDSSPAYYGFTNKEAAWFIMKEDSSGNYTYAVGSSGFDTNWTNRNVAPPPGPTYGEFYDMF